MVVVGIGLEEVDGNGSGVSPLRKKVNSFFLALDEILLIS